MRLRFSATAKYVNRGPDPDVLALIGVHSFLIDWDNSNTLFGSCRLNARGDPEGGTNNRVEGYSTLVTMRDGKLQMFANKLRTGGDEVVMT
jgi:hypothetical protein